MTDVLALPPIGWDDGGIDSDPPVNLDRMAGRRTETLRFGTPWWTGFWRSVVLTRDELAALDAWIKRLQGGALFRAHDILRPRPMAHDNGQPLSGVRAVGGTFDGTATLDAITDALTVTVSGLPAGFELRAGDYVEFAMHELLVSLHMITADATAGGSGEVTLQFAFALDLEHFTTAATVNFEEPACLMQIDPGSYDGARARKSRMAAFTATEVFPDIEDEE